MEISFVFREEGELASILSKTERTSLRRGHFSRTLVEVKAVAALMSESEECSVWTEGRAVTRTHTWAKLKRQEAGG